MNERLAKAQENSKNNQLSALILSKSWEEAAFMAFEMNKIRDFVYCTTKLMQQTDGDNDCADEIIESITSFESQYEGTERIVYQQSKDSKSLLSLFK